MKPFLALRLNDFGPFGDSCSQQSLEEKVIERFICPGVTGCLVFYRGGSKSL